MPGNSSTTPPSATAISVSRENASGFCSRTSCQRLFVPRGRRHREDRTEDHHDQQHEADDRQRDVAAVDHHVAGDEAGHGQDRRLAEDQRAGRDRLRLHLRHHHLHLVGDRLAELGGLPEVPDHHDPAGDVEEAAERAGPIHDLGLLDHGDPGVLQTAVRSQFPPAQPFGDTGDPHRHHVEQDAEGADPEVPVGPVGRPQFAAVELRCEPVEQAGGHESVPAERATVDVRDDPVGVVCQRTDAADREQWALEGRHAVEGHAGGEELEDRVGAELVPRASEGQQAVEHAAPGRCPQHQAEHHAERLAHSGNAV